MSILDALLPVPQFPLTILLVDDQPIVFKVIQKMIEGVPNLRFHYCSEGKNALSMVLEVKPNLILQDLVMPDSDGLELLKEYRMNPLTRDIPVVVLSAQEDPKVKAEAFALGANDYIVKLPDQVEFLARIHYHANSYIRLLERNEAFRKLEEGKRILTDELAEAASYVRSLLPSPLNGPKIFSEWVFIPSKQLGGDIFGYHWIDDTHFAIYLLDVCGHGVGAALMSVSVFNFLRSENLPKADFKNPSSVLAALNQVFQMEDHNNMFFTIWYGVYETDTRVLLYASGGHPPVLLISDKENLHLKELRTEGSAIGIEQDSLFINHTSKIEPHSVLYIYSDGVVELEKRGGEMGTLQEWIAEMRNPPWSSENELEGIVSYARMLQGKSDFVDDFSLLKITFDAGS